MGGGVEERRETLAPLRDLYYVAEHNNAVRKSIQTLVDYSLKEGYEWVPKFGRKCKICAEEYPETEEPNECAMCGAKESQQPDGTKIKWYAEPNTRVPHLMDKKFKKVNDNGHGLIEILRMEGWHRHVCDDGFIVILQDYELDLEGKILNNEIKEIITPHPMNFGMISDPETKTPGGKYWICLNEECRPGIFKNSETGNAEKKGRVYTKPGACDECDRALYDVWYVSMIPGNNRDIAQYYIEREVIHTSQYGLDYGHGLSQLVSVYNECKLLMVMIEYMKTFYDEERLPRIMITYHAANPDAIKSLMEISQDRNASRGKHYVPEIVVPPTAGVTDPVKVHELSKLPEELQYLDMHDYLYRRIASAFGIAPVFHGNVDAVGLQTQGPTQWAVTELAAYTCQWVYNHKVFPFLLALYGVTDWDLKLKKPEPEDEMETMEIKMRKAQYASLLKQLGFKIKRRDKHGDFEFEEKPFDLSALQGMGQPGMMQQGSAPPPPPPPNLPEQDKYGL